MLRPAQTATPKPSVTEVNLRRLLARCDALVGPDAIASPSVETPIDQPTGHAFNKATFSAQVQYMRKLLAGIETNATGPLDQTALGEYARRINILSDLVDTSKLVAPVEKCLSQTRLAKHSRQTQSEKNSENEKELRMIRRAEEEMKSELLQKDDGRFSLGVVTKHGNDIAENDNSWTLEEKKNELFRGENSTSMASSSSLTTRSNLRHRSADDSKEEANTEVLLAHHQQQQEDLTSELARMAKVLKNNSLAFGDILKRDEKTLNEAQSVLGSNLTRLGREGGRLQMYAQQSGKTTVLVLGVVSFVCFTFVFMYLYIRMFPKAG